MARFIPKVRTEDIPYDSEKLVYEALGRLSDEYVVMHSFPWLRPRRDLSAEPLREGEADFVLLHPQRGMLVLEVKGGTPSLAGRVWLRAGKEIRNPFEQARRNKYALLDAMEERTGSRLNRRMFTYGEAVIFPHSQYDGPLPLDSDPRTFIDARGLPSLDQRIEEAFEAWGRSTTRLAPSDFALLQDALMPKLRLMRCAGSDISLEGERIVQVTLDQRATLLGLLANDRVLIEGTAGSGKTLLAMEFGITLASRGSKVLLLCYNKQLAAWLQEQAKGETRLATSRNSLEVATFHSFAVSLARRAQVEFAVPAGPAPEFWDEEVPLILEQALDVLRSRQAEPLYDAVIVDEAQDFSRDWWVTVESLTRGGRQGRLYAFLDLRQSLRTAPQLPPVPLQTHFHLTTNCRNTRSIARSASSLSGAHVTLLPGIPEGEEPAMRRAQAANAQAGLVLQEVRGLLRQGIGARQIVVIGPAAMEKGSLAEFREVDGIPLIADASEWRVGGGVLVTTSRAFKGLEADVVIIYDLSGFGNLFTRTDLYVAWTRARHRLVVICHGAEVRAAAEEALADAAKVEASAAE